MVEPSVPRVAFTAGGPFDYARRMVANPQRRALLQDAGLRVLAATGARGLTHRAVDRELGVPIGTCTNYFRTRDALLGALAERVLTLLAPDPERLERLAARPPSIDASVGYIRYIVERLTRHPELALALYELRLESARRPGLAAILQTTLREAYAADVRFNDDAGLPGGARDIALLHYAIEGLLLDRLTVRIEPDADTDEIVEDIVRRILGGA